MSVRVRFAPSPTGFLHIGNVRTALFNYLFARHEHGTLILRIEDTDPERSRHEYSDAVMRDLELLGLQWDEGPYYQSKQIETYQEYLDKLWKENKVYYCFCTQEELKARRREALSQKKPPRYDNRCRTLPAAERKKREAEGVRPTIRFKVEATSPIPIYDLIRGEVKFDPEELGDFVLMRPHPQQPDQYLPTFHMSVCVDDSIMKISHVIRGEDHLSNSPRHALLFQALGFPVPKFAHLSLIHGPGGEPLSKRYGSVSVSDFLDRQGYLPEALRNYLALLGWSPKDNREIFNPAELEQAFDLSHAVRHPAIFTEQKLIWINSEHLKRLSDEEYLKRALRFLKRTRISTGDKAVLSEVLVGLKKDIHRFDELPQIFSFLNETAFRAQIDESVRMGESGSELLRVLAQGKPVIQAAYAVLKRLDSSGEALFQGLKEQLEKTVSARGAKLYLPIRAAVTAQTHGIELKKIFMLLDRSAIIARVELVEKTAL